MKISFIRPNMNPIRSADAIHPLEFSVLASLTPNDVDIELFDERIEEIPFDIDTDLVAITAQTFTARRAYEIADQFKKRGVPVILGGYHPTFLPEEALKHADSVLIGEAEESWGEVVQDARFGKLARIYNRKTISDLSGTVYRRDLFQGKKYNKLFPVEFNRGCRFNCDFCSVSAFNLKKYKTRPLKDVIQDINKLNAKYILFVDDNIFCDKKKSMELFEALIPLNIKWGCQISIDSAQDEQMLQLMSKSGCIAALIGFESLSKENLKQMKKATNIRSGNFMDDIKRIKDNGIMINGSFVFGYDFDTPDVFDTTVDFAIENHFYLANFNTLNPMPGTELYNRFYTEKRLIKENWWTDKKFQYGEVMFYPAQMTPQQLKEGCIRARKNFYSYSSMFNRLFDLKTNLSSLSHFFIFWGTNLIARKEIMVKMAQLEKQS